MTKARHTPGPWKFRKYATDDNIEELKAHGLRPVMLLENDGSAIVNAPDGDETKRIATVTCQTKYKRGEGYKTECAQREANALLIAAAPDLLAELKRLYEKHGYQSTADVIAKAEGH